VGAKIAAIVQARTASTRLPKKVLLELPYGSGITVLEQVIRRLKKSKLLDEIIVATTTSSKDDPIVEISKVEGIKYFRGSEKNVLERYYLCAKENKVDIVVRITSDCPCVDWNVVDKTITFHLEKKVDYTSNSISKPYPLGLGVEVVSFETLERTFYLANDIFHKEHVTTFIKENPSLFSIGDLKAPDDYFYPNIRLTLDTMHDYLLLCYVFDNFYYQNPFFSSLEVLRFLKKKEWPLLINEGEIQKRRLNSFQEELQEAIKLLNKYDLKRVKLFLENLLRKEQWG
jgi:spore coat polysaccharide biosynthesis protein SpsF